MFYNKLFFKLILRIRKKIGPLGLIVRMGLIKTHSPGYGF